MTASAPDLRVREHIRGPISFHARDYHSPVIAGRRVTHIEAAGAEVLVRGRHVVGDLGIEHGCPGNIRRRAGCDLRPRSAAAR